MKKEDESVDVSLFLEITRWFVNRLLKMRGVSVRSRHTGSTIIYYFIRDIFSAQCIIKCIKCNFLRAYNYGILYRAVSKYFVSRNSPFFRAKVTSVFNTLIREYLIFKLQRSINIYIYKVLVSIKEIF